MEKRNRERLQRIYAKVRAAERRFLASADVEKEDECADDMRTVAMALNMAARRVIKEIKDADAEELSGGEDND